MYTWRKIENENGIPFYINEELNKKQWDHPMFPDIKKSLEDCNYVKFAMYRVALKFRTLQKYLFMEHVPVNIISGVFERHRLGVNESSLLLESCDLEAVLNDIHFACNKQNSTNTDIDLATDLTINLLFNIYDNQRHGKIDVASTKLLLGFLSSSSIEEVYRFFFALYADHNNCITRLRLQHFLNNITAITKFLQEDNNFGSLLVVTTAKECFSYSPGLIGVNENSFIQWLSSGPQLLSWFPILHRLRLSESVVHQLKCSSCKSFPIRGLRYKCTKCSKYIQCQQCFFTGNLSHSHKLSHSMREYCYENNNRENNFVFVKRLVQLLPCSVSKEKMPQYVIETKPLNTENHMFRIINSTLKNNYSFGPESLSPPELQLNIIIKQLELKNSELQNVLQRGTYNENEIRNYLEDHRLHVEKQIQKLKILKERMSATQTSNVVQNSLGHPKMESTPMPANCKMKPQNMMNFEFLSPVISLPGSYDATDNCNQLTYRNSKVTEASKFDGASEMDAIPSHFTINDISTWIGGNRPFQSQNASGNQNKTFTREGHTELDDALVKLQQILANNFSLEESLGNLDNSRLQFAVSEVEGVLSTFIDRVESNRASSTQLRHPSNKSDALENCNK